MDLIARLKLYIDHLGLPSSVFADTAQIPRPTLSQILSGRNKKISNELIAKLHTAFPSLNVMWLLFGDGEMESGNQIASSGAQNNQNSLDFNSQSAENEAHAQQLSLENFDPEFTQSTISQRQNANSPLADANSRADGARIGANPVNASHHPAAMGIHEMLAGNSGQSKFLRDNSKPTTAATDDKSVKHIESIMVFYTDNSFEVFRPAE